MAEVEENHGICPVFKRLIIGSEVFNIAVPAVSVIWRRINFGTRRELHGNVWNELVAVSLKALTLCLPVKTDKTTKLLGTTVNLTKI